MPAGPGASSGFERLPGRALSPMPPAEAPGLARAPGPARETRRRGRGAVDSARRAPRHHVAFFPLHAVDALTRNCGGRVGRTARTALGLLHRSEAAAGGTEGHPAPACGV